METLPTRLRTRKSPPADSFTWHLLPHTGVGLVEINGTLYRYEQTDYAECDGTPRRLWKLRKQDGTEHQLHVTADGLQCDCEWSTFRPDAKACKHRRLLPVIDAAAQEAILRAQRRRHEEYRAADEEMPF